MQKYQDVIVNSNSVGILTPTTGAVVTITNTSGGSSQMYSDNGITPIASVSSDTTGFFQFYANDGTYTLTITGASGTVTRTGITLQDTSTLDTSIATLNTNIATANANIGTINSTAAFLSANNTFTGNDTFNNPVTVGSATAAGHAVRLGQINSTTVPVFSAYSNATQSVTTTTLTKVILQATDFNNTSMFVVGTTTVDGLSRFTPTIAGYYQINAQVRGNGTGVTLIEVDIQKNGTTVNSSSYYTASNTVDIVSTSGFVFCNGSTDYIEMWASVTATTPTVGSASRSYTNVLSGYLAVRT